MKTLSYAILLHNEVEEIKQLLDTLTSNIRDTDEIVIVVDDTDYYNSVVSVLTEYDNIKYYKHPLNNNFSEQKNFLNSKCNKDYIVNLDADELLDVEFIKNISKIIEVNESDVFILPRINTLDSMVNEKIQKAWGWNVDKNNRINFPDWQMRIYKNSPDIVWKNKVHEILDGFSDYVKLPEDDVYAIKHNKSFFKQFQQNCHYNFINVINNLKNNGNYFDIIKNNVKLQTGKSNNYDINYYRWLHPYQGNWELTSLFTKKYMTFLEKIINNGDVVLDIGAQCGNMSVAYSTLVGEKGKVISFEPNPATFEVLLKNKELNPNIDAYNYGVTNTYSVETFHYSDNGLCNGGFASNTVRGIGVTNHTIPIPVYTINLLDFLNNDYSDLIDKITFIKIDAEGYDRFIIPQLKYISQKRPTILTEIYSGLTQSEVEDLLLQIRNIDYIPYDEELYLDGITKEIKTIADINIKSGHNLICFPKYT